MAQRLSLVLVCIGITVWTAAAPLYAEAQQKRPPSRILFDENDVDTQGRRAMSFTLSVSEGYDQNDRNPMAPGGDFPDAVVDPRFLVSGAHSSLRSQITYVNQGQRLSVNLQSDAQIRYQSRLRALSAVSHHTQLGLAARLGRRALLQLNPSVTYTSYNQLAVSPVQSPAGNERVASLFDGGDRALVGHPTYHYGIEASLTQPLTQRTSLDVDYGFHQTDFVREPLDLRWQRAGGRVSRRLTRRLGLHAGYHYLGGTLNVAAGQRPIEGHDLDLGVDYSRPLSFSRRTTIALGSGSSLVTMDGGGVRRLLGYASVARDLGRTWRALAEYRRGLGFADGFAAPFFSHTVAGSVAGWAGPRVQITGLARYSRGDIDFVSNQYDLSEASAGLRVGLTRHLALDTQYFFYRYHFAEDVGLAAGLSRQFQRQGVRAGLAVRLPASRN